METKRKEKAPTNVQEEKTLKSNPSKQQQQFRKSNNPVKKQQEQTSIYFYNQQPCSKQQQLTSLLSPAKEICHWKQETTNWTCHPVPAESQVRCAAESGRVRPSDRTYELRFCCLRL